MSDYLSSAEKNLQAIQGMLGKPLSQADPVFDRIPPVRIKLSESCSAGDILTTCMVFNMLARMHPIVRAVGIEIPEGIPLEADVPLFTRGTSLRKALRIFTNQVPKGVIFYDGKGNRAESAVTITIGEPAADQKSVSVTSDGWWIHLNFSENPSRTRKLNPIGAYASACFAVAEVFKLILRDAFGNHFKQPITLAPHEVHYSVFDYRTVSHTSLNPDLPETVNLGQLGLIGVGAGGGALIYTLTSLSGLSGNVALVDPDEVTEGNLNRYVYAVNNDAKNKVKKVLLAQQLLWRHRDLKISPIPQAYQDCRHLLISEGFLNLLVTLVDNHDTRRKIQYDLPREILNAAANQDGYYVLNRIEFGRGHCLACVIPRGTSKFDVELAISEKAGIDVDKLREMKSTNAAFTFQQIARMKEFIRNVKDPLPLPEVDMRYSDWTQRHCGMMSLDFESQIETPVPFVTVLPGVLLAGELVKLKYFPNNLLSNFFLHSMLNLPVTSYPAFRPRNPDCEICRGDAVSLYHEKYGEPSDVGL